MTMQAEGSCETGPLDKSLRPKGKRETLCIPHAALRSNNLCQQLLTAQLGWRMPPSLDAWRRVQACTALMQLQLPPVWRSPPSAHVRQEVACLQLQQAPGSSCSSHSSTQLAAVGYTCGTLHIIRLADMLEAATTAAAAAAAAAGSQDDPGETAVTEASSTAAPAPAAAMPHIAALPPGCVWSVDLQDRLAGCCWAAGELPELATAGPQGVKIRRFVEGRHHEYSLRLKGGGQLAKPVQVAYLDKGAAYTLAAAHAAGVMLWDCRAASRAVAELPTGSAVQLMQAMPGGTVLLTAAADGQMALYDVRRLSSSATSVVNFGGSRASQQLLASFNVPARAEEAAASANDSSSLAQAAAAGSGLAQPVPDALLGGSSSSSRGHGVSCRIYPFFRDVLLNPADPNLVAYVRPDLQVGLFDLHRNRVLQQVCVTEVLGSPDASLIASSSSSALLGGQRQAPARGCWDASGRVLYTHGLLQHCQAASGVAQLQPTLAAIDFGSWTGRQQRRNSSCRDPASQSSSSSRSLDGNGLAGMQAADMQQADQQTTSMLRANGSGVWRVRGGGLMCRGGQVLHLPMAQHAAPTELAAASSGQLLAGTLQGDVICLH